MALLARHADQVKAVVAGHIHNDFHGQSVGGIPLFASPSTVFQFEVSPEGHVSDVYDNINGPAYRLLELDGGEALLAVPGGGGGHVSTSVHRVPMPPHALKAANNSAEGPRMDRAPWPADDEDDVTPSHLKALSAKLNSIAKL